MNEFSKCMIIEWVGLVADIDIESEKYRWMGGARLDFYVCKYAPWLFSFGIIFCIYQFDHLSYLNFEAQQQCH